MATATVCLRVGIMPNRDIGSTGRRHLARPFGRSWDAQPDLIDVILARRIEPSIRRWWDESSNRHDRGRCIYQRPAHASNKALRAPGRCHRLEARDSGGVVEIPLILCDPDEIPDCGLG